MYAITNDGPWIDLDEVCSVTMFPDEFMLEIGLKSGEIRAITVTTHDNLKSLARQIVDAVDHRDDPEENPRPRALT